MRGLACTYVNVHGQVGASESRLLINIHEPFFVFLFSLQQDATETW